MARPSNDTVELRPRTSFAGPELRFDFPGLQVGVAEYDEGPTGCTVFTFADTAALALDVRGGSPATSGAGLDLVDAICLAGGSLYGLEAAAGVAAELLAARGYRTGWQEIPLVAGAIVFDWGRRDNAVYPDKELGRAAVRAARAGVFPVGRRGAGRSATAGKLFAYEEGEPAGQGGAFRQVGETKVAVFAVVNAIGAIVDRDGNVVRGHHDAASGLRRQLVPGVEERLADGTAVRPPPGNTTLTVVVTNLRLDQRQLRTLGRQVHASLARAIQPFHALEDGDVLFAVSTGTLERDPLLDTTALGVVASELAWDAVLSVADDPLP
ncbi:MAG TPA: P1 family peptidase [Gaiellaceae bacterium]|nr:P1 family peptidase [Gaiellaceae bacterium]